METGTCDCCRTTTAGSVQITMSQVHAEDERGVIISCTIANCMICAGKLRATTWQPLPWIPTTTK